MAGVIAGCLLAAPAEAFETLDGRIQAHGFFESQLRVLNKNYSEDWDVAQWYNVFNLELELDILSETLGPLDLVSAYVRLEGRYDCVYSRGCGMFRSVNAYGNRSKSLPRRISNAEDATAVGTVMLPRTTNAEFVLPPGGTEGVTIGDELIVTTVKDRDRRSGGTTDPVDLRQVAGFTVLAGGTGPDLFQGTPLVNDDSQCILRYGQARCDVIAGGSDAGLGFTDDPFLDVFGSWEDFRFTQINTRGGGGDGLPTSILGPWLPKNFFTPVAGLADRVNPFDSANVGPSASSSLQAAAYNEVILADAADGTFIDTSGPEDVFIPTSDVDQADVDTLVAAADAAAAAVAGGGANPYRPIPTEAAGRRGDADGVARGLYYPSQRMMYLAESGRLDSFDFNFSETERSFNQGASQQDQYALKEGYLDIELFDTRLWLRIGLQNIVWGKTELFRTTDQFNPQDLALASLPSLEESRIALWAFRGVYSLYEVGPLEDVRLELAINFDEFEPNDLGACGEAYTPNVVCTGVVIGAFAHANFGFGLAGVDRPPDPWDSAKGLEVGGRMEFRWDRFSFAISDFYGFNDLPTATRINTYERNVDPRNGRPRIASERGICLDGDEDACLLPGPTDRRSGSSNTALADVPGNALEYHHANQQLFAVICSTTIGFSNLDVTACAQSVFGSTNPVSITTVNNIISGTLAGAPGANGAIAAVQTNGVELPLVQLSFGDGRETANPSANVGPDGTLTPCMDPIENIPCGGAGTGIFSPVGMALALTPEQESLLGCGPYWGTNCDASGMDLLNADVSALLQSFAGYDGTFAGFQADDASMPQPGTVGFAGGAVCTFGNLVAPKQANLDRLPGCRGPGDPGYKKNVDGNRNNVATILNPNLGFAGTDAFDILVPLGTAGHPFTAQKWQSEMAALSWNFQMLTVALSAEFRVPNETIEAMIGPGGISAAEARTLKVNQAYSKAKDTCSYVQPQFCSTPQALFAVAGVTRNDVRAGGNSSFGRRTFVWHSGGEVLLTYERRNVLGFSMDFAEDVSKTNWGIEATWINNIVLANNNRFDGNSTTNEYNLTISMDRPTFVNFLNANRTFFFTTQWFFRYWDNYQAGMTANGPWNILGIAVLSTGYYQDRLLPSVTFVYDVQSTSGAVLPQITYRYNEAFSVTVGAAAFLGREQLRPMPLNGAGTSPNTIGSQAYQVGVENGLAVVRDRDEVFVRLRYTF